MDFELRQGDTGRLLQVRVKNADGTDTLIPNGTTAQFRMVHRQSGHVVTGVASIGNPPGGTNNNQLSYTFAGSDSAQVGVYDAVFVATYPLGGGTETFPTCSNGSK